MHVENRTRRWPKTLALSLMTTTLLVAWLTTGVYKTRFAEDNRLVFFIKKQPTFQVAFVNPSPLMPTASPSAG